MHSPANEKNALMMTPQLPTRDVTFDDSHKLKIGRNSKLDESRFHAHEMIDELISLMGEKKRSAESGVKRVEEANYDLLSHLMNSSSSPTAESWRTTLPYQRKSSNKNMTFHGTYSNGHKQRSITAKNQEIYRLKSENSQLRQTLHKNDFQGLWRQLQELKEQNELLRKQTRNMLMRP